MCHVIHINPRYIFNYNKKQIIFKKKNKKNVGIEKKLLIFNDSITAPGCMATGTCIQVYVYNLHV